VTIGADSEHPYRTNSIFNISGMSYGAISRPAALALSHGAHMAGIWMNTGEGGLSPYQLEGGADIVFQIGTAKYGVRDEQGRLSDEKIEGDCRARAGAHVRTQTVAGRQARQGRHLAGDQSHGGDRGHPRHPAGRLRSAPIVTRKSPTNANCST
jgi:hypothetical protein